MRRPQPATAAVALVAVGAALAGCGSSATPAGSGAPGVAQDPNFQPFRQQFSETLNSVFSTCGPDVKGDLGKLAENLKKELQTQGMSK